MSKKKQRTAWYIFVAIFVLPLVGYFVANGYWWLYDGNIPNDDKMGASFCLSLITVTIALAWAWLEEIFND